MNSAQLPSLLAVINPRVIQTLMNNRGVNSKEAGRAFYNSELYAMLENEESKLWHLSAETLYDLLEQELNTGKIDYPEEA
ncbi:MAG: hypothetical protein LBR71_06860 [Synergistaceae bacterium]|jgi:hypothetical protein|nr:hypothetical protein [Synergistaceae bacterium]